MTASDRRDARRRNQAHRVGDWEDPRIAWPVVFLASIVFWAALAFFLISFA